MMTAQIVIGILAVCLVSCLAALIVSTAYFLRQWKKMDRILDNFQQAEAGGESQNDLRCSDVSETRESRVISQLIRILSSARYKERQAQEERKQTMELVSDLSHQFKTPLANIVMDMELLLDCELEEDKRNEFLAHAKSQADKLQWLMADLLKASRLENGIIRFEAENTGIKRTIAQAVSSVYAQVSAKNITLEVEEFEDFALWHNPKWTAEAMSNILENAVKYSPENSRIQIAAQRLDLYTKITITDEGIGIPESDYNLIFKRFYRGREVEQQEGSGLGLCLAQLILQCEQGYITVSSKVGRGSSFSMFLLNADEASGK
ncbi:MAG: HAMP domain-containing histidine kinase [Lachnospiraceae bacterium]|nr:HAMP domain-containing histidine kinase [Lachnospiraceae bacterium]